MGLLSWTIGLPLQPVRGVVALGRVIQRQVELEQHSAQSVRRRLEELEQESGQVSEEQRQRELREIVSSRISPKAPLEGRAPQEGDG
jgi:hypothetical protein